MGRFSGSHNMYLWLLPSQSAQMEGHWVARANLTIWITPDGGALGCKGPIWAVTLKSSWPSQTTLVSLLWPTPKSSLEALCGWQQSRHPDFETKFHYLGSLQHWFLPLDRIKAACCYFHWDYGTYFLVILSLYHTLIRNVECDAGWICHSYMFHLLSYTMLYGK